MVDTIKRWFSERNRVFRTALQVAGASAVVGILGAASTLIAQLELSDPIQLALVSVVTVLISTWMNMADARRDSAMAEYQDACDELE